MEKQISKEHKFHKQNMMIVTPAGISEYVINYFYSSEYIINYFYNLCMAFRFIINVLSLVLASWKAQLSPFVLCLSQQTLLIVLDVRINTKNPHNHLRICALNIKTGTSSLLQTVMLLNTSMVMSIIIVNQNAFGSIIHV